MCERVTTDSCGNGAKKGRMGGWCLSCGGGGGGRNRYDDSGLKSLWVGAGG